MLLLCVARADSKRHKEIYLEIPERISTPAARNVLCQTGMQMQERHNNRVIKILK